MCPGDDEIMKDIQYLQETVERLLADFARLRTPLLLGKASVWRPLTDVYETDKEFVVRMDVAGMDPRGFDIALRGRVLTIRGVRRDPTPSSRKHFHKMEISLGPFERNIAVPAHAQMSAMEAHYEEGYLVVRMTKGVRRISQKERMISVHRG
jgi:HSP20 family protein